jgi:hypothetical protein
MDESVDMQKYVNDKPPDTIQRSDFSRLCCSTCENDRIKFVIVMSAVGTIPMNVTWYRAIVAEK